MMKVDINVYAPLISTPGFLGATQLRRWLSLLRLIAMVLTTARSKKQQLASNICNALTIHTIIEEEILYPAFIKATEDKDTRHEAIVEHAGAKKLIAEIQAMSADEHHAKEEEQPGGCSPRQRNSIWISMCCVNNCSRGKKELQAQAKAA